MAVVPGQSSCRALDPLTRTIQELDVTIVEQILKLAYNITMPAPMPQMWWYNFYPTGPGVTWRQRDSFLFYMYM